MTGDETALLALHEQDRRAHLEGDADLLVSGMAADILEAGRGGLAIASRSDLAARFSQYFASVRYTRWEDMRPPHIVVAGDGRSAWMAIHIRAELTGGGETRAFESSWIAIYENASTEGKWLMTAIASSVADRP